MHLFMLLLLHPLVASAHLISSGKMKALVSVSTLILLLGSSVVMAQSPALVSINRDGTASGNDESYYSVGSTVTNGRYVAFTSIASDLVAQDTNRTYDAFVRDLRTGTTILASVNASGTGTGNGKSGVTGFRNVPTITLSANGRYVAFSSSASDLVVNDTNGRDDVFVRDLVAGTTTLISVNGAGTASGNESSTYSSLSADGRVIGFRSLASDLVPNDTNNTTDVFVRNLETGVTTLVSVNSAGTASGNRSSFLSNISGDGRIVAFTSTANDLIANDSNGTWQDVFVRNLQTGTTTLVSVSADGSGSGNSASSQPVISADGRKVVFTSHATNLVTLNDSNDTSDVFVRDLALGRTTLISVNRAGTGAGAVVFISGLEGSDITSEATISANGNIIAFVSDATDLVDNDPTRPNGRANADVFVRDVAAGTTTLVSVNREGTGSANLNSRSNNVEVSANGRFVVFDSIASDLVVNDTNLSTDVFVRDLQRSETTLVSRNTSSTDGGDFDSFSPSISPDGSAIVFHSDATDLVTNDTNAELDVFAFALTQFSIQFNALTYNTVEGNSAVITITRTGDTSGAVSATFTTTNGTAIAGQDYAAVNQVVTFADGDAASKTVTIPITDDTFAESAETVNLTLTNPTGGAVLGNSATATLTIADNDSCIYSVSPSTLPQFSAEGGQGSFQINTRAGCSWTATSLVSWITINSGSGTGNGTISFTVAPNTGPARTGQILHTDDSFYTITQAGGCTYSLNPTSETVPAAGGAVTITVTASDAGCNWTAVSNNFFITIPSGTRGTGNGTVTLSVSPNITGVPRTGTATIAGRVFTVTQPVPVPTFSFAQNSYGFSEGAGRATLVIWRSGDLSGSGSVEYRTIDDPTAVPCAALDFKAYARCDYATTIDVATFGPNEGFKEISIPLIDDAHLENRDETVQVVLSKPSAGSALGTSTTTLSIHDNDVAGSPNPIFRTPFFVRMQYLDFLSREPEAGEPWSGVLNGCSDVNNNPACDRILVSSSFFGSPEFRLKGFFVYTFYRVAFDRRSEYAEIIPDMRNVTGLTPSDTFTRRAAFPVSFVQRQEFMAAYGGLSNAAFVAALLDRYELQSIRTPDPQNPESGVRVTLSRADLVTRLGNTGTQALTRAQVLRAIVESDEVGAREFNGAFVAMQYYGYLRRTPEASGYEAWLRVINQDPQNVRIMVNGFMNSIEYRLRFGTP